jgi:hypothetical protein
MKRLSFIVFLIFLSISVSASYFEGTSIEPEELGLGDIRFTENMSCVDLFVPEQEWSSLKEFKGILGVEMNVFLADANSKANLFFYDEDGRSIAYNTTAGSKVGKNYGIEFIQNNFFFLYLESFRDKKYLKLEICGDLANTEYIIAKDLRFGSYKLPYFQNSFRKEFLKKEYKIGEKLPIKVKIKNEGFALADLSLFFDNSLFTKWFKLAEGEPSIKKVLEVGGEEELIYNITPQNLNDFIISPAVLQYKVKNYVFNIYSNSLIVDSREYLDTIFCDLEVEKERYDLNENVSINVELYNDSNIEKEIMLTLVFDNNLSTKLSKVVKIKAFDILEKENFSFVVNNEQVLKVDLYLSTRELNETNLTSEDTKNCGSETILFKSDSTNYAEYIIILFLILAIAIYIYYHRFV